MKKYENIVGSDNVPNEIKGLEIGLLIREINSKINSNLRHEFENTGLTVPQIMLIRILVKNKRLKVSEISKKMNLANSTVSGIIDRLEKQKILKKTRSSEDKRITYIELADKGREIGEYFHKTINSYFQKVFEKVSEEDMKVIFDGLQTLKKVLDRC
ncbi:MarR family winged helix-turn-helix transcriptional regulator [Caloranaerobacter azorensis]|uniref:MarR family winged helix-turn-helix transcriptional regulator n=1 Tax=Caloranaerobacter azorensis TaxID=116090 RepID=UPI0009DE22FE|nr:MarR family transcriptional regulator [Caloranaerobacter azorensis]